MKRLRDIVREKKEIDKKLSTLDIEMSSMDKSSKEYDAKLSECMKLMGRSYSLGDEAYRNYPSARKEIEELNGKIYRMLGY